MTSVLAFTIYFYSYIFTFSSPLLHVSFASAPSRLQSSRYVVDGVSGRLIPLTLDSAAGVIFTAAGVNSDLYTGSYFPFQPGCR